MPADLTKPFGESCCDGGACTNEKSAQPCGCDKGANWTCQRHQVEAQIEEARYEVEKEIREMLNK